jgi:hypothetical protein
MEAKNISCNDKDGLHVVVYPGDTKVLIAMSLDDDKVNASERNLAGFAIWRKIGNSPEQPLPNRVSFTVGVSRATTAKTRTWTDSDKAPFQKFRWIDVPPDGFSETITYRVRALYFVGQGSALKDGPEVAVSVSPAEKEHSRFHPAFTRGYIASQAYAVRFHNADIRPKGAKTPDFDTTPYKAQYAWLGADAYSSLFAFLKECEDDKDARVKMFAYDFDEPDVIAAACRIGKEGRLQAILDNADLHVKPNKKGEAPPEVKAASLIKAAAGAANVKQGKFDRFQHNKVFIKCDRNGSGKKVYFGSMNFSVRGLYVQANNVIVIDDAKVAGMFSEAFDVAFKGNVKAKPFKASAVAKDYMEGSATDTAELPRFSLALSPHSDWHISLQPMANRIHAANSSVLFAVMEPNGQGPVLGALRTIAADPVVFSYGTVETDKGLAVQSPDGAMGDIVGFSALTKNVPAPFTKEYSGGAGKHVHNKFVVVDFNGENPTVFTGSSNLAAGGEQANGDSLVMIEDAAVANMYAIEAVALFDHYHFRKAMQKASKATPLTLWFPGKPGAPTPWWSAYYDKTKIQLRDRCLFARVPLPAGLATVKNVDWAKLDKLAEDAKKKPATGTAKGKKAAANKAPSKKAAPKKAKKELAKSRTGARSRP